MEYITSTQKSETKYLMGLDLISIFKRQESTLKVDEQVTLSLARWAVDQDT